MKIESPSLNPSPQWRENKVPSPSRPMARSQRLIEGEGKAYGSPIGSEPRLKEEPTAHRGEGEERSYQ
jgi:hypothetical protein